MFERYTEHARRTIFFSRYEAAQVGSPYIEPEHFLLGLLRERVSFGFLLPATLTLDAARSEFQATSPVREKISTSVDLPLSHTVKRILAYGAEEAERLNHGHIGPEHLLLGLLHEDTVAARMLRKHGLDLDNLRQKVAQPAANLDDFRSVDALREKFRRLADRLTPDIEPASIYCLRPVVATSEDAE